MASIEEDLHDDPAGALSRARRSRSRGCSRRRATTSTIRSSAKARSARSSPSSSPRARSSRRTSAARTSSRPATSPPPSTTIASSSTISSRTAPRGRRHHDVGRTRSVSSSRWRLRRTPQRRSTSSGCRTGEASATSVAVEEPLEIRIGGSPVAVTMRTPGHDEELALGFCISEGLQPTAARLPDDLAANTVDVEAPGFDLARLQRSFYTSSSCGVCGKGALEAVAVEAARVESQLRVPLALVVALPDRLREAQAAFAATGGLHATGPLRRRRRAALRARGRRPPQRDGQGDRLGLRRRAAAAR